MLCQIILTPWESRRLIAKAVVQLPEVQNALARGIVCIARGTTTSFIVEEITGDIKKEQYCIGSIWPEKMCLVQKEKRLPELSFVRGKAKEILPKDIIREMGSQDVFIKGANAVDPHFEAGILLGSPTGGTTGSTIGAVYAKGINFIIPVGLEKLIPYSVKEAFTFTGINRVHSSMGISVGFFPVVGKTVTEIQALEQLGVHAMPIASGGINGAEGATILSIQGEPERIENALELIESVKGEPPLKIPSADCTTCDHESCGWKESPK